MKHRARHEDAIQRAVFQHLALRAARNVFAFHPANGGYRTATEAAIFKGLGVRAGTPDVIIIKDGRVYGLELKPPGKKPTERQIEAMNEMRAAGAICAVATGIDEALSTLESWQILKGRAQ